MYVVKDRNSCFVLYCSPQTNRRDETRRVSITSVSSAGVRGPVFASFPSSAVFQMTPVHQPTRRN